MSEVISKGTANNSCVYTSDCHNISNTNNLIIFNKVVSGNTTTPTFDYLLNYQTVRINDVRSIMEYNYGNISLEIAEDAKLEEIEDKYTFILPAPKISKFKQPGLIDALEKRGSVRKYIKSEMPLTKLSTLLKYSFGVKDETQTLNGYKVPRRYYGSGGGLYSIKVYVYVNSVEQLQNGVYKYQPFSHSLRRIEHDDITITDEHRGRFSVFYAQ